MNLGKMRRRMNVGETPNYLMTSETNPEVLAVCYAQGWCASTDYMTYEEAAAVNDIGETFRGNRDITHFEELAAFGITCVSQNAFRDCTNLAKIKVSVRVNELQNSCFRNTQLMTNLEIPEGVTNIRAYAFNNYGRRVSNPSIVMQGATPPILANVNAFDTAGAAIAIYVPAESVETYKAASVWRDLADRIFAIPT